jgi:hypothetical protein
MIMKEKLKELGQFAVLSTALGVLWGLAAWDFKMGLVVFGVAMSTFILINWY